MDHVEDDVDELPDSYFSKASAREFDKIDNRKDGFLPSSIFVEFIETVGESFHIEYLAGHMRKVDPHESEILDRFAFVR